MEPEFVNESMWDEDEGDTNNDETNFGEDDSNMEMTGFDGSATGDGNITGGEGGAVGDAQGIIMENEQCKTDVENRQRLEYMWIKQYVTKIKTGVYQCFICHRRLKMPYGSHGNMKRHFKNKHPYVFAKETNDFSIHLYTIDKKEESLHIQKKTPSRRAWVRKYMSNIKTGLYSCDICYSTLRMRPGELGNMRRHFKTRHPAIYARERNALYIDSNTGDNEEEYVSIDKNSANQKMCEDGTSEGLQGNINNEREETQYEYVIEEYVVEKEETDDLKKDVDDMSSDSKNYDSDPENEVVLGPDGLLEMWDLNIEAKIKKLCQKGPEGKRGKNKTCFWNFFKFVEGNVYACLICNQTLPIFYDSVGNLKRHITVKHKEAFQMILKYIPEYDSSISHRKNDSELDKGNEQTTDLNKDIDDMSSDNTNYESDPENRVVLGTDGLLEMSDPDIEAKIKKLCENGPKGKRGNIKTCFWNFFKLVEGNVYACLFCNQTIPTFAESVGNLKRHTMAKHKEAFQLILKYIPEYDASLSRRKNKCDLDKEQVTQSYDKSDS